MCFGRTSHQGGPAKARKLTSHVGDCQNYGPLLGLYYNTGPNTGPNLGDPKRDHNFDNPPCNSYLPSIVILFA